MVSVMRRMKEPGVGSRLPLLAYWVADFPTFQLSNFPICQLVGKLESWRVDAGADQGEGGHVGG